MIDRADQLRFGVTIKFVKDGGKCAENRFGNSKTWRFDNMIAADSVISAAAN